MSNWLGLPLSLGAFVAGLMISEFRFGYQALADLIPLRDLFATVFFVSVGMLLDPAFVFAHGFAVAPFVSVLIAGKMAEVQPGFEASIEIARLVLLGLEGSAPEIRQALEDIKLRRYAIFQPDIGELSLKDMMIDWPFAGHLGIWFKVHSPAVSGMATADLNVCKKTGATIRAVKRGEDVIPYPDSSVKLMLDDELYALGTAEQLLRFE